MIGSLLRLGLGELAARLRLTLVMTLAAALSLMSYLLLEAFRTGLVSLYSAANPAFLVVQSSGSMGEFFGSRLPPELAAELSQRGASLVVPQIHSIIGATPASAILLRGVSLETYTLVEDFTMLAGRPLQPGDPPRSAMIGARLAEKLGLGAGQTIDLRGRPFRVVGIFAIGTYADHEAWVPLGAAQELLSWGGDVSVYVIPAGEGLAPGEDLPAGASVVQKGNSGASLKDELMPFFDLLKTVVSALGLAAALALGNLLWRLAWQRWRELAILRSLGYERRALALYLLAQGGLISALACAGGGLGAWALGALSQARSAGISLRPIFDLPTLAASLGYAALITLIATAVPIWQLARWNLTSLLRDE